MAVETDIAIVGAVVVGIGVTILPSYLMAYYNWAADALHYPGVDFFTPKVNSTDQARGHARFLIDQAGKQLDIASNGLNPSIWDEELATKLQKALDTKPGLSVRVLTGPDIGDHRLNDFSGRVAFATLGEPLPLEGILSDDQVFRKLSGFSDQELVPGLTSYRNYDGVLGTERAGDFGRQFERLWALADRRVTANLER